MAVPIIDPRGMKIEVWSAMTTANLVQFGFSPQSCTLETWPAWAQRIAHLPQLSGLGIPEARGYDNRWQDWGFRLNEALLRFG